MADITPIVILPIAIAPIQLPVFDVSKAEVEAFIKDGLEKVLEVKLQAPPGYCLKVWALHRRVIGGDRSEHLSSNNCTHMRVPRGETRVLSIFESDEKQWDFFDSWEKRTRGGIMVVQYSGGAAPCVSTPVWLKIGDAMADLFEQDQERRSRWKLLPLEAGNMVASVVDSMEVEADYLSKLVKNETWYLADLTKSRLDDAETLTTYESSRLEVAIKNESHSMEERLKAHLDERLDELKRVVILAKQRPESSSSSSTSSSSSSSLSSSETSNRKLSAKEQKKKMKKQHREEKRELKIKVRAERAADAEEAAADQTKKRRLAL